MDDLYFSRPSLKDFIGVSDAEIASFESQCPGFRTEKGFCVNKLVRHLLEKYRQLQQISTYSANKTGIGSDVDTLNVLQKTREQNLVKIIIHNNRMLGLFLLKTEAKERMTKSYSRVKQMLQNCIHTTAVEMGGDIRKNTEFLTRKYNDAIKTLEQESTMLDWEDDGDAATLKKFMTKFIKDSEEFDYDKLVEGYYDNIPEV